MTQKQVQAADHDLRHPDQEIRDTDPNVLQRRASDTRSSVWVSASAGTGKTKVLTDRVLRLLLPRSETEPGTPVGKILCLTFTKAGAGEMALRISKTLAEWASFDDVKLAESLGQLFGRAARPYEMNAARELFAHVLDDKTGLQIMTIHAFCGSVLSRFPLEAGLMPYFRALTEEEAAQLLETARKQVFSPAQAQANSAHSGISAAVHALTKALNEDQFAQLEKALTAERYQFQSTLERHGGTYGLAQKIFAALDVPFGQTEEDVQRAFCTEGAYDEAGLRHAVKILAEKGGKKDQGRAIIIENWLNSTTADKIRGADAYKKAFLTDEHQIFKNLTVNKIKDENPDVLRVLEIEAERYLTFYESLKSLACAQLTQALMTVGAAVLERYAALKEERGALDFDDLIYRTLDLLSGRTQAFSSFDRDVSNAWVSYKLDEGLDHILVDEAQDTNPEQWKIIEALCTDFFAGDGAHDRLRTVFVVGDEKQSIYSFQRASPQEFKRMQAYFAQKVIDAGRKWDPVALQKSFRTTKSVLALVDAVFAPEDMRAGLGDAGIEHFVHREGQAGLAEIWPLFETKKAEGQDFWQPPVTPVEKTNGAAALAKFIAAKIRAWLDHPEDEDSMLKSNGRPIEPGDIMILMRTRTKFVEQLARELKQKNIPISGVDRMVLNDQIAVQDLMAAAGFVLLPEDSLTLACLLKSPLVNMSEEDLMHIAAKRAKSESLWNALRQSAHSETVLWLENLIRAGLDLGPFAFFSTILQRPCPGDTRSGMRAMQSRLGEDAADPIDELLSAALRYELQENASLQGFLHHQTHNQDEIKREMEEAGGKVRIMTVHGSKGLQAPIVILPDTIRLPGAGSGKTEKRLLWPGRTDLTVPLWCARREDAPAAFKHALAQIEVRADEEYRRLLYVAMTRAEDRLYIGGYTTSAKKTPRPDSWYYSIKQGFEALSHELLADGSLRIVNYQVKAPDRAAKEASGRQKLDTALPGWIIQPAPTEPETLRALRPSAVAAEDDAALSPLQSGHEQRFLRGNITHKLLQILPGLAPSARQSAALTFVERYSTEISEDVRQDIVKETMGILNHPEFTPIFGPGSLAEVPVSGLIAEGTAINGQIDRLLITEEAIWIIDYKTNRPSPKNPENVPQSYYNQLRSYALALRKIYPDRAVRCALLWTDVPLLMPLPLDLD